MCVGFARLVTNGSVSVGKDDLLTIFIIIMPYVFDTGLLLNL